MEVCPRVPAPCGGALPCPALLCSLPAVLQSRGDFQEWQMESKGLLRSELLPSRSPRCSITEGDGKACCAESSRAKSTRSGEVRSPSGTAGGEVPEGA